MSHTHNENIQINSHYLEISGWVLSMKAGKPVNERGQPIPWYSYPAIEFIEDKLHNTFNVFEYGMGQSSLWFSQRVNHVYSVEHDPIFFDTMKNQLTNNITARLAKDEAYYACEILKYSDNFFDIIAIDGVNREQCTRLCYKKIKKDGFIIFDNADRETSDASLLFLASKGFKRIDFFGLAPSLTYFYTLYSRNSFMLC